MCNHPINSTCTICGERFCVRCNPGEICQECERNAKQDPGATKKVCKEYTCVYHACMSDDCQKHEMLSNPETKEYYLKTFGNGKCNG